MTYTAKPYVILVSFLFILLTLFFNVLPALAVHSLQPPQLQRVHCGAILASRDSVQPCLHRELLDWHGTPLAPSQSVTTPLRWTMNVLCLTGSSVEVSVSDAQMRISQESFVCDGKWHQRIYYPLEDVVFFGVSRNAEIQVWT